MDLRNLTERAAERIKSVFSKDNRFFYGNAQSGQEAYQDEAQQAPAQGAYPNAYQQAQYQQQAAYGQPAYQQAPVYQQYAQAPQPLMQQQYVQQAAPAYPQQGWQAQTQPAAQQAPYAQPTYQQAVSPQQAQLNQQAEQTGRNRRAAQHMQPEQPEGNIVPFPGAPAEQESRQMDAYVVNITNITGCRQAMSCLRKGQCTLVVMDQLVEKAEVRRYVDMLNGACFALGGTMTRLSLKVGFYILAPAGMMVYTDPLTASANAPQPRPQHGAQQPANQVQGYASPAQEPQYQQPYAQQQYPQQQQPYAPQQYPQQQYMQQQQYAPQQQYAQQVFAQPQQQYSQQPHAPQADYHQQASPQHHNPYMPPAGQAQEYQLDEYDAQRYAQ